MNYDLLPHQDRFIQNLMDKMHNNFLTVVIGASGCGKSFVFKDIEAKKNQTIFDRVIVLDSDYISNERDYSPFKNSAIYIGKRKEGIKQRAAEGAVAVGKDTPFVGNTVSYLIELLVKPQKNAALCAMNEDELSIINEIKKAANKNCICIICDNIHWWDRRSLILLMQLVGQSEILTEVERDRIRFVLSITDNQDSSNTELVKEFLNAVEPSQIIYFPVFEYLDFKNQLYIESGHRLSEDQVKLLYTLVNGHLKVYFEIIRELKQNSFDFNASYESNKKYLDEMLDRRLKECGATGTQIAEVLEYASIIGMTFSTFELEVITDSTKGRICKIINDSNTLRLTENSEDETHYKFAHDIIREVFVSKVNQYHVDYYIKMSYCLREIKPGQYLRRARYMMYAMETEKAATLYLLECIYQLRTYGNIPDLLQAEASKLLTQRHQEYLEQMQCAYQSYHLKDYNQAQIHLKLILNYYPEALIAERDILKLRCYSKKLATKDIILAIQSLDQKRASSKLKEEAEVWERYSHALITAYAHVGEITRARAIEEELLESLASRLEFDESANHRLNVIKRNANAIHDVDISPIFVEQAVRYFGNKDCYGNCNDLKQYYSALTNYSAALITRGDFLEAYDLALTGFQLQEENPCFPFSRPQILKNNFIIAGILAEKISLSEGIDLFKEILGDLAPGMAERLFYTSNLSILYALGNDAAMALDILNNEVRDHNIAADQEGLYRYRVITNTAVYQHILGETDKAMTGLETIQSDLEELINGSFFKKKNELLIQMMRQNIICSGKDWLEIVHLHCPVYQGQPWRYFGLGYAFAALCDWGV